MIDAGLAGGPAAIASHDLPRRSPVKSPWLAPVVSIAGAFLLVLAGTLPVWGTSLIAPQYPKGLALWFFGGRIEGPVREVNALNHYIGMRPINLAEVPELALWPVAIAAATVLFVIGVLVRGWAGRLALLGLFLVPVVVLADIQRYLIMYGSELDRASALRLDPFVPLVVGPSSVWNFTVWTYPGPALLIMWALATTALVVRRASAPGRRAAGVAAGVALAVGLLGTILVVVPAVQSDGAQSAVPRAAAPPGTADLVRLVDEAPAGATVIVPAGSYAVHLDLRRPITLIADGDVVLDGHGRGSVLTITANDVTVKGFRITGTGGQVEDAAAIKTVEASRVRIEGNRLEDFFTGIAINGGSEIAITGNVLAGSGQVTYGGDHATSGAEQGADSSGGMVGHDSADPHAGHGEGAGPGGQGDGISVWTARGVLVRENRIAGVRDAVYLNYAEEVLVDSNTIDRSRYAVHAMFGSGLTVFGNAARRNVAGLVFMYSSRVLVGRNLLSDAREPGGGVGVALKDVTGIRIAENRIERNRVGMQVDGTVHRDQSEALVVRNRIAANGVGIALFATADLAFGANEFDGNLTQVLALEPGVERHNDWTNGGTGNTWSDYAGFDLNGDGVGDVPYVAAGLGPVLAGLSPALDAYRTSPALAILAGAQAVWESAQAPAVRDHAPRTHPAVDLSWVGLPGHGGVTPVASTAGSGSHAGHAGQEAAPAPAPAPAGSDGAGEPAGDLATAAWRVTGLALIVLATCAIVATTRVRAGRPLAASRRLARQPAVA